MLETIILVSILKSKQFQENLENFKTFSKRITEIIENKNKG